MTAAIDFVAQQNWTHKLSGDEIVVPCPFEDCPNVGQPQLYINRESGKWFCHRCGSKGGNLKQLQFRLGLISMKEPVKSSHISIPLGEVESLANALLFHKEAMSYLTDVRGFTPQTIIEARLGYKAHEFGDVISIPMFDKDQNYFPAAQCVGMKYYFYKRTGDMPKMLWEKDSKKTLFNLHRVNLKEPLIITEGEFDALSLWQCGYKNVGSVPNGAQGCGDWTEDITGAPEYLLGFDNDSAGNDGVKKLGASLGLSRCSRVYPRLKDWNEYLQCGADVGAIKECFDLKEPMVKAPFTSLSRFVDEALFQMTHADKAKGCPSGWKALDNIIGGFRYGEHTIVTGSTGNGKSTWLECLTGELAKKNTDWKFLIISGEEKGSKILRTLASNYFKRPASSGDIVNFQRNNEGRFYIHNIHDEWSEDDDQIGLKGVFDIVELYIKQLKVNFIIIDHAHLFIREGANEIEDIRYYVQKTRRLVSQNPIHIASVVQPTKLGRDQRKVKMANLRGSVLWEQGAWNVITVHRDDEKNHLVEFEVEKNREFGTLGLFHLTFDVSSKANYYEANK